MLCIKKKMMPHNKNMKKKIVFNSLIMLFVFIISGCLFPTPIFSKYANITSSHIMQVNDYNETEMKNNHTEHAVILKLKWNIIDNLICNNTPYEVCDATTKNTFSIKRVGGTNHADVVHATEYDLEIINELFSQSSYNPVLIKINEKSFVPASLNTYRHGYDNHMCLHFEGSTTDGTKLSDIRHQKAISIAKRATLPG